MILRRARALRGLLVLLIMATLVVPVLLLAQDKKGISTIRDEEIEQALRAYVNPIFRTAGIVPENVDLIIVNDNSLNAFVAGGMKMFVHTGLIEFSEDPLVLIGVMAHETGHISGGHLIRVQDDYEKAGIQTALSYILGAASIAAGAPQAGQAIISGGSHAAQRSAMKFSRLHEEAADQAALSYLTKLKFSPKGLAQLLEKLKERESIYVDKIDPYAQTHPVSKDRILHIKTSMQSGGLSKDEAPEALHLMQQRVVAKLNAFTTPPAEIFKRYPSEDTRLAARYARAIAHFRVPNLKKALEEIDALLATQPNDPYFVELKGQMLFEHGKVREAIPYYSKAVSLKPESSLFRLELAMAQLATEDKKFLKEATEHLRKALLKEPRNALAWRQLAIAYGRDEKMGMSYLALAEESTLLGKKEDAEMFIRKAEKVLPHGSPSALRLKDLERILEEKDDGFFSSKKELTAG
jgi:predicted Zn-dependent protease